VAYQSSDVTSQHLTAVAAIACWVRWFPFYIAGMEVKCLKMNAEKVKTMSGCDKVSRVEKKGI